MSKIILSDNTTIDSKVLINRMDRAMHNLMKTNATDEYKQERLEIYNLTKEKLANNKDIETYSCNYENEINCHNKYLNNEYDIYLKGLYEKMNENKQHLIIIDPPYGNDVNYSELSEFFLAWDKPILKKIFHDWDIDLYKKVKEEDKNKSFGEIMNEVWDSIKLRLHCKGTLTIMFASSKESVWKELFEGLNHKFTLVNYYPITCEPPNNGLDKNKNRYTITMCMIFKHVESKKKLQTSKDLILKEYNNYSNVDLNCIDWVGEYAKVW